MTESVHHHTCQDCGKACSCFCDGKGMMTLQGVFLCNECFDKEEIMKGDTMTAREKFRGLVFNESDEERLQRRRILVENIRKENNELTKSNARHRETGALVADSSNYDYCQHLTPEVPMKEIYRAIDKIARGDFDRQLKPLPAWWNPEYGEKEEL